MTKLTATIGLTHGFGALSINKLYVQPRGQSHKILNQYGRTVQKRIVTYLVKEWALGGSLNPDQEYSLTLRFFFPRVYTQGWPKKAKNKFVSIDQSNFIKFIQDCVTKATGVDDKAHFDMHVYKRQSENTRVEIELEAISVESEELSAEDTDD